MGQYYKTAKPTFVDDVIYQAPYELMARALQAKDLQVEKDEAEYDEFDVLGDDKNYTDKDKAKRNEIIDGHREEADRIARGIQENPQNRAYYMRQMGRARKKFDKDIKTGFLNDADLNFTAREKAVEEIDKRTDISHEQKQVSKAQLDQEFQGSDALEGNTFNDKLHIYEALDEEKFIQAKKAEITADSITTKKNRTDGRYFTDETGIRKFISDERLDKSFEGSTGVGKWEKARLQTLERQVQQGVITQDEANATYSQERKQFKDDFINSLGFEQVTETDFVTRDGTRVAESNNALGWARFNKEELTLTQDTKIDPGYITTSDKPLEDQTTNESRNSNYNTEGTRIKNKLGNDYSAIEAALKSGDTAAKKAAYAKMKTLGYSPTEVLNLRGFLANKERNYIAVETEAERKGYLAISKSTPDNAIVQVKYTDETTGQDVIREMPLHEARALSRKSTTTKTTESKPTTVTVDGQEVLSYKDGTRFVAIEDEEGNTIPATDFVAGTLVNGRTPHTSKVASTTSTKLPYSTKGVTVSTSETNFKYDNPFSEPTKTKVVNYHEVIDNREVIISIPIDANKANIINN